MLEETNWIVLVSGFLGGSLFGAFVTHQIQKKRISSRRKAGTAAEERVARGGSDPADRDRRD